MQVLRGIFRELVHGIGRTLLLLAGMALTTALGLAIISSYLLTYPITRVSPRSQRMRALGELVTAGMTLIRSISPPSD